MNDDALTMVLDQGGNAGETFGYRWSIFKNTLTFRRDDKLGSARRRSSSSPGPKLPDEAVPRQRKCEAAEPTWLDGFVMPAPVSDDVGDGVEPAIAGRDASADLSQGSGVLARSRRRPEVSRLPVDRTCRFDARSIGPSRRGSASIIAVESESPR